MILLKNTHEKLILLISIILLITIISGCKEKIITNEIEYELVNLNGRLNGRETGSSTFFILSYYSKYKHDTTLTYMFFYKDEYGRISYKQLEPNSYYNSKIYIIENNNKTPTYKIKRFTDRGMEIWVEHYLTVPVGTILNTNEYEVNIKDKY